MSDAQPPEEIDPLSIDDHMVASMADEELLGFVTSYRDYLDAHRPGWFFDLGPTTQSRIQDLTGEGSSGSGGDDHPWGYGEDTAEVGGEGYGEDDQSWANLDDIRPQSEGLTLDRDGRPLNGHFAFRMAADSSLYLYTSDDYDEFVAVLPSSPRYLAGTERWQGMIDLTQGEIDVIEGVPGPAEFPTLGGSDRERRFVAPEIESEVPQSEQVDSSSIARRNQAVVAAMVARGASDADRRVPFMMGGGLVLIGDGHDWGAVNAVGADAAHGFVRFRRNRLSANEFVVESEDGVADLEPLDGEIRRHIAYTGVYDYGDAERVRVHEA
jgi:hypothetical protein